MEPLTQRLGLWVYGTCASGLIIFILAYIFVTGAPKALFVK